MSPAEELDIVLTNLGGDSNYTMFVVGYPGFPMPQALDARRGIIESSVQRLGELAATT